MTDNNASHLRKSSEISVRELDSAGTTLIGSARSTKEHSFDRDAGERKYADVELNQWDRQEQARRQRSTVSTLSDEDASDDEEAGRREDERLLGHDAVALHENPAAAATLRAEGDNVEVPPPTQSKVGKPEKISWSELPKKGQLAILTLARMSEPLAQTSLASYMFYQLKSFKLPDGSSPSDSMVARQTGFLAAAFTGAQFLTAMIWGRLADNDRFGRKRVILIGLLGTCGGVLGYGFSRSFAAAVFWRAVAGVLNGNTGVMRTMISEMIKEKKFQSRAFLLMPMTANIGVIIGPLLGGLLADPAHSYPGVFGEVAWMKTFPYALPNVFTAAFLLFGALAVIFGLDETLEGKRERGDWGRTIGKTVTRIVSWRKPAQKYDTLWDGDDVEMASKTTKNNKKPTYTGKRKLAFKQMWTRNVCFTLLAHGLLVMHAGTFGQMWFVFLSTPRYDPAALDASHELAENELSIPKNYQPKPPFTFTGGLALPPPSIGTALAILGVIGITLQLALYPSLSFKWGTAKSYRCSLLFFPIAYFLAPFLAVIPSSQAPPYQASGFWIWAAITLILSIQVMGRTFALPATAILVNNACPHPSVLGTMHGVGQSVSSLTRTVAPIAAGWLYGVGLSKGIVGLVWWCMAGLAMVGAVAGRWVKEGDGHEIWLEGEREEMELEGKPP